MYWPLVDTARRYLERVFVFAKLVLLELTASTIVEVHDAALDAVVVSEVCLSGASLVQGLLCLDLNALEISLVLDGSKEIVNRSILALELILMVAA